MTNLQKWKILKSEMVLNHKWFKVRRDEVKLHNGKVLDDYFLFLRPDVVQIFPVTKNNEIVFVRQYRHGSGKILLELPAGNFHAEEESAESAAKRELEEETGYLAQEIVKIATLYDNPPKETNQIHVFFAKNVMRSGEIKPDITEDIEVVLIPVEDIVQKITDGKICVSEVVAAIFLGLNFLESEGLRKLR